MLHIYFPGVLDSNLDVTLYSLLAVGVLPTVPVVFLVNISLNTFVYSHSRCAVSSIATIGHGTGKTSTDLTADNANPDRWSRHCWFSPRHCRPSFALKPVSHASLSAFTCIFHGQKVHRKCIEHVKRMLKTQYSIAEQEWMG